MPKNRLLLISLAALIVALGAIVFAPFVVSNGVRLWLRWQAHRQQLKIELGKVAAPFLRPVSIERIRVTSQTGAATQIELNAEGAVLHLSLVKILAGRSDGVRTLSIQAARAEIRRDYSEKVRAMPFNWTALQSLLPANFDIAHLDSRVENGPTVILLRNASLSGNQIEAGRFSAGEFRPKGRGDIQFGTSPAPRPAFRLRKRPGRSDLPISSVVRFVPAISLFAAIHAILWEEPLPSGPR